MWAAAQPIFPAMTSGEFGVGGQEGIRSEDSHDGGAAACAWPA